MLDISTFRYLYLIYSTFRKLPTLQWTGTVQYSTVKYNTVKYNTVQYSTVQYSKVQYSTVQYSKVQYSTVIKCILSTELCGDYLYTRLETRINANLTNIVLHNCNILLVIFIYIYIYIYI